MFANFTPTPLTRLRCRLGWHTWSIWMEECPDRFGYWKRVRVCFYCGKTQHRYGKQKGVL